MIRNFAEGDLCRIRTTEAVNGFVAKRAPTPGWATEPIRFGTVKEADNDIAVEHGAKVTIQRVWDNATVSIRLESHPDLGPYAIASSYLSLVSPLELLALEADGDIGHL